MIIHSHKKIKNTNANVEPTVKVIKVKPLEVEKIAEEKNNKIEEKPAIKKTTRKRVTYLDNNED